MIRHDEDGVPVGGALDAFNVIKALPGVFIGGTANARGDENGTSDPTTLFTVTGDVLVRMFAVCTTTIVGAGTIEVGVTGNTAELLPQVSNASTIAAGEVWVDATVDDVRAVLMGDITASVVVTNGSDIIETVGTANLTAGELYYVCMWKPLTPGSSVVAA